MIRLLIPALVVGSLLGFGAAVRGHDEADDELLPPPRELQPAPAAPVYVVPHAPPIPAYYRTSAYDVWQLNAVDRRGFWRPRVMYSPYGAYYLYNGQRYPWAELQPTIWQPWVTDSPAGTTR